jgi:A/G-specific adenine glycosylase
MLQQTPVARVLPVFEAWMKRWPQPVDLAGEPAGDAVRAWGRLGYPRRALRLHAAAQQCVDRFGGRVPCDVADLQSLPGVGEYTAAAIACFAFGQRQAVLDTNVRRVHARWLEGIEHPTTTSITSADRQRALGLLPTDPHRAAVASIAVMELGALVCTSRTPKCDSCPLAQECAWRRAGYPEHTGARRRSQAWVGTDRQCRGTLMALMRETEGPVTHRDLHNAWSDTEQRERGVAGLVADGLIVDDGATYRLP